MKIAFYSPYLPKHTGGGEKYMLDCARLAAAAGHQVFIAVSDTQDLSLDEATEMRGKYEQFLDCSLVGIEFIATPLFTSSNLLKKLLWTRQFDCLYYQTDGSLFFSLAKKNILHIQVPLPLDKSSFLEKLKLANWSVKNTNSYFTKNYIEKYWRTKIDYVHQPYVELPPLEKPPHKEQMILSVGRFFRQLHSKRQDVLVEFFKKLVKTAPKDMKNWELILIGRAEDQDFANQVAAQVGEFKITLIHDADRGLLLDYYQRASIYWHATGYGIDENVEPEKAEHFGISTLEAMAAGVVPVVINKGGQKEILGSKLQDCMWDEEDACLAKTLGLIKNKTKLTALAQKVKIRSQEFSKDKFNKILLTMLDK